MATRSVVSRLINATEHKSDTIVVVSHSFLAWVASGGTLVLAVLFGYLLYSSIDAEYFMWKVEQDRAATFWEHLTKFGIPWFHLITLGIFVASTALLLSCLWRVSTRWTVCVPANGVVEIKRSGVFGAKITRLAMSEIRIRVGRYLNPIYKRKTIGTNDVVLVMGNHAFLVDFGLSQDEAHTLASRLSAKLSLSDDQLEERSMIYLLPYILFN